METHERPLISAVLIWFGIADIIGGIILGVQTWPGEPTSGYKWLFSAYLPALTWISVGLVSGVLFFAVAAVIHYLSEVCTRMWNIQGLLSRPESKMWEIYQRTQSEIRE